MVFLFLFQFLRQVVDNAAYEILVEFGLCRSGGWFAFGWTLGAVVEPVEPARQPVEVDTSPCAIIGAVDAGGANLGEVHTLHAHEGVHAADVDRNAVLLGLAEDIEPALILRVFIFVDGLFDAPALPDVAFFPGGIAADEEHVELRPRDLIGDGSLNRSARRRPHESLCRG